MIDLFWFLFALILYCYLGYPVLLLFVSRLTHKPIFKKNITPSVSVVISVWNEQDVIARKIKNLLSLDYPADQLEIIIGSDGSDDRTNEIISSFKDARIKLHVSAQRRGKMAVLNELVTMAKNEVIVFNDARQELSTDAVRMLVANLADPTVGCVSGELVFRQNKGTTGKGINLYWEYEKFMRNHEARIHSMLGATGAIYAIRKELYRPVPEHVVLDDMYIPFRIIEQGYRAIFEPDAKAFDDVADNPKEEYRRKTRTLFGNFQIFQNFAHMFNPFASPIAVQFLSHKLLRVIAPFVMVALLLINFMLIGQPLFLWIMGLQCLFYVSALLGMFTKCITKGPLRYFAKICYIPYVFCLLNFSVFAGFWRFITAQQQATWEKARWD